MAEQLKYAPADERIRPGQQLEPNAMPPYTIASADEGAELQKTGSALMDEDFWIYNHVDVQQKYAAFTVP